MKKLSPEQQAHYFGWWYSARGNMKRYQYAPWVELWLWDPNRENSSWTYYCKACNTKGWNGTLYEVAERAATHALSADHYRALDSMGMPGDDRRPDLGERMAQEMNKLRDQLEQQEVEYHRLEQQLNERDGELADAMQALGDLARILQAADERGIVRD